MKDVRSLHKFTTPSLFPKLVFAYNEVFHCTFRVKGDTVYAVLLHIGLPENATKYKYKVKFFSKDKTEGVTVMHFARSFTENLDDIFKSGNCGKLHYDLVSRLADEESNLDLEVTIRRVGE
jgi:hypothetical protein